MDTEKILKKIGENKTALKFFGKIFNTAIILVGDNEEEFTVVREENRYKIEKGRTVDNPTIEVKISLEQVNALLEDVADEDISQEEKFRICAAILKPVLIASYKHPLLQNKIAQKILLTENVIHIGLQNNNGTKEIKYTVKKIDNKWIVEDDYKGKPERKILMTPDQALKFNELASKSFQEKNPLKIIGHIKKLKNFKDQISVYI